MVNPGEVPLKTVRFVKPEGMRKMLLGLGQKACGQVQGLSAPLPQMWCHRSRGMTSPARVLLRNMVSPLSCPPGKERVSEPVGAAGSGCGSKRRPPCSGADRG